MTSRIGWVGIRMIFSVWSVSELLAGGVNVSLQPKMGDLDVRLKII